MAQMAELDSGFNFNSFFNFGIKIAGFRDSFDRFTCEYIQEILDFVPKDQQLFNTLKQKERKSYENSFLSNPYQLAYNSIIRALRDGSSTSPEEKVKERENITLEDLVAYAKQWKSKVYMEFYMTGNLAE